MTAWLMMACFSASSRADELLLGGDVAADAPVHVVQVADDEALFEEGWEGNSRISNSKYLKSVERSRMSLGKSHRIH